MAKRCGCIFISIMFHVSFFLLSSMYSPFLLFCHKKCTDNLFAILLYINWCICIYIYIYIYRFVDVDVCVCVCDFRKWPEWNMKHACIRTCQALININMEFSACFVYILIEIVTAYGVQSQSTGNMTRYDRLDFSYNPNCTQFLPCVTVSFGVRGKWQCGLMAQRQQSDIFVYDMATTTCQLCPLSIATDRGSTIPGSHIAYVRGQYRTLNASIRWQHCIKNFILL